MYLKPILVVLYPTEVIIEFRIILVPPHGLEVKPFLRVRFAQPLSVLHTS